MSGDGYRVEPDTAISNIFEGYAPDPPINLGIPDDPGVAFIEALDLMTRTMLKHQWTDHVVKALPVDERDELLVGSPIHMVTMWMDLIQRRIMEANNGS